MATAPCPKCNRTLLQSGEVTLACAAGATPVVLPTFQCDECLVATKMFGEPVEVALTFVVLPDGRAVDPAAPDAKPPWAQPPAASS